MKVTLEFPDSDAEFVLELLRRLPRLTVRPVRQSKPKPAEMDKVDETTFLLRHPTNAKRLLAAMERSERGEYQVHDLDLGATQ